jgi:uncharacterized LabA/DUF88 family protein
MHIGIYVDISNLYFTGFHHRKMQVDYRKLYNYCKDYGDIKEAHAYGGAIGDQADGFKKVLTDIGFTPHYKEPKTFASGKMKCDWDVGMTVDIMKSNLDGYIICSADTDFEPLVNFLREKDKYVLVMGINIKKGIEIPKSIFLDK